VRRDDLSQRTCGHRRAGRAFLGHEFHPPPCRPVRIFSALPYASPGTSPEATSPDLLLRTPRFEKGMVRCCSTACGG
jgi:hypothetical protein